MIPYLVLYFEMSGWTRVYEGKDADGEWPHNIERWMTERLSS